MKRFAWLLLALLTVPAYAAEVLHAKRLPKATLLELAARPESPRPARETRHDERQRPMSTFGAAVPQSQPVDTGATIAPPPIAGGFAAASSTRWAPADASGAVGPSHLVGAFNSGIVVQNREGKVLAQLTLEQFWRVDGIVDETYDPRIAYDAIFDRWVTIAIKNESAMVLAVSKTGDPTGEWTRYSLAFDGGEVDFSRLALTRDTIVAVTERVGFSSCLIVSTQKQDLYAGGQSVPVNVHDTRGSSSLVVPVASGDSDVEYLLTAVDAGSIAIKRLDEFQWQNMASKVAWEPGWFFGKQRDTGNDLDFGFDEIHNAVLQRGTIHAAQMIGIPGARGRTAILWTRIDPQARTILEQGVIDDGTAYYGFPSIAVNRGGAALIAYATMSKAEYPSARYVFLDVAGRRSSEATVKEGTSSIRNTDRWGDYTTTLVDPRDDSMFWTLQIYADNGHWAAWWAKVKAPPATNRRRATRH